MRESKLLPKSHLDGLTPAADAGAGILLQRRDGRSICMLSGRREGIPEIRKFFAEIGIELPDRPRAMAAHGITIVGTGPETWLAICGEPYVLAATLRDRLNGHCAITDQTDGIVLLRLSGNLVRNALAKGIGIDLHASAFRPGDAATTSAAHVNVTLWRLEDRTDGAAVFDLAVTSSYAASFMHWLITCSSEFGIATETVAD